MADKSAIEWTDATWNPVVGCTIVSPGCTNCYAMRMAARLEKMGQKIYTGTTQSSKAGPVWTGKVAQAGWTQFCKPMAWTRPRKIFVNSMSDLFQKKLDSEIVDQAFVVMAVADQHEYQILTKRPELAVDYLLKPHRIEDIYAQWSAISGTAREMYSWPMKNVLIGVSVEDQRRANERLPYIRDIAEAGWRTFVSYEPALGGVDWKGWEFLSWMISGGESGPNARPSHPDWHRETRDWCGASKVPYLFKQWGEFTPGVNVERQRGTVETAAWFDDRWLMSSENLANCEGHVDDEPDLYRVGKKAAGRLLDGAEHNGFPEART
jgi:protein gp37